MKCFLYLLLFIPVLSGGQAIVPGKVNYQGHAYWRLGDHKDTAYLASPAWGWQEFSNYPVPVWQTEQYYNDRGEIISVTEVPSLEVFLDDDPSFLEEWR